jgi:DNA-binding CsgD family transcriptional regulator/sugar-specific transcriptional regulator TrmB
MAYLGASLLEELGLDSEAESVYRLMLAHRDWGVGKIAEHLRVAESQVRDVLNRLADLTLLRQSRDVPEELYPVNPELALQLLLQRQQAELLERQQRFAESQAAVSSLIADYMTSRRAGISESSESLAGLDAVQSRLEELAHRATSVCMSFMPGGGQSAQSLTASRPLDELMLRRRIAVLTVYLDSVRNDPATLAYARWLTELGGGVRTTPTLPLRMVLFDRRVALVPIDAEDSWRGAVQVTVPGILTGLVALFEQIWEAALPLGDESQHVDGELTGQERELLRLLSQGLTDQVAARRLGVSLRTERRMMANIMQRLSAHSRFEAGLRASERRWLGPLGHSVISKLHSQSPS